MKSKGGLTILGGKVKTKNPEEPCAFCKGKEDVHRHLLREGLSAFLLFACNACINKLRVTKGAK